MGYRHYFYEMRKIDGIEDITLANLKKQYGELDVDEIIVFPFILAKTIPLKTVFEFGTRFRCAGQMEEASERFFKDEETHNEMNDCTMFLKANKKTIDIAIQHLESWNNVEGESLATYLEMVKNNFNFQDNYLIFSAY